MPPKGVTGECKLPFSMKNGWDNERERCPAGEVPSTGWIRATQLFPGGIKFDEFGNAERKKILRELSKVKIFTCVARRVLVDVLW